MFEYTKIPGYQFIAISIPPSSHKDLSKDFKELSRIHFYLGNSSIEHMIKAVENASLEEIDKGKMQITFATKEILDFFYNARYDLITYKDSIFKTAIENIYELTIENIKKVEKEPKNKTSIKKLESLIILSHECELIKDLLKNELKINFNQEEIKKKYSEMQIKTKKYPETESLKNYSYYKDLAEERVLNQLNDPFNLDFIQWSEKIYFDEDNWSATYRFLDQERNKIDAEGYVLDSKRTKELKDLFLEQMQSFNRLSKEGLINYFYLYKAAINIDKLYLKERIKVTPEEMYSRDIRYYEKDAKISLYKEYSKEKLEELKENKETELEKNKSKFLDAQNKLVNNINKEEMIDITINNLKTN